MIAQCCPVCLGRGWVWENFYTGQITVASNGQVACRSCGGQGIVWAERPPALPFGPFNPPSPWSFVEGVHG